MPVELSDHLLLDLVFEHAERRRRQDANGLAVSAGHGDRNGHQRNAGRESRAALLARRQRGRQRRRRGGHRL
jgi:hypothetical protein